MMDDREMYFIDESEPDNDPLDENTERLMAACRKDSDTRAVMVTVIAHTPRDADTVMLTCPFCGRMGFDLELGSDYSFNCSNCNAWIEYKTP